MTQQSPNGNGRALLEVRGLKKYFRVGREDLKAVDGISVEIKKGETLGLVGESGCGKTTVGRVLVRLYEPSDGEIIYNGDDITKIKGQAAKSLNRKMQMIFQDPQASLNPRMVVSDIIAEGIDIHGLARNKQERLERVHELLETVGLNKEHANRFPHEFSGGQRQRIGVARALAVDPELLLMDEPFAALDAQTRELMQAELLRIWNQTHKTVLFITHQIDEAIFLADRVVVMSARPGRIKAIFEIDIPRPRTLHVKREPKFLQYLDEVWTLIEEEVRKSGMFFIDDE